jgi:pimeloyl-ACP methyl ester carboxylesterase
MSAQSDNQIKMQAQMIGSGQPLILVPGGLAGWLSWEPHAKILSDTRKVIRVQLLNVQLGLEDRLLPPDYSVRFESQGLKNTLGELGLNDPLDVVAWSYGAEITLDYALPNPSKVRSLVLIEPPAYWVLRASGKMDAEAKKNAEALGAMEGDISEDQLEQFALSVGLAPPGKSPRTLPQWPVWVQHRRSLRNNPYVVSHSDDLNRVRVFQPPVLLVKGTGSAKFLHQIIDVLAAELPHARVVEMPAGHAPQIVSMERFLEEIREFQTSVGPK